VGSTPTAPTNLTQIAPSWTVTTGEKENQLEVEPNQEGCATSFIMQERGEISGICNEQPNPTEQYVQPDSEKEDGGEGLARHWHMIEKGRSPEAGPRCYPIWQTKDC
jgi:hypothetical protein